MIWTRAEGCNEQLELIIAPWKLCHERERGTIQPRRGYAGEAVAYVHLRSTDDRIDGAGPDHSDGQLQHASPLRVDVRHRFRGTVRTLAQSECGNDMHPLSKPRCIS